MEFTNYHCIFGFSYKYHQYYSKQNGFSAILFAAKGGCVDAIHTLLARGAEYKDTDRVSLTTHFKYYYLFISQLFHFILIIYFSLFFFMQNGNNALMLACEHGHTDLVTFLLSQGASPEDKDIVSYMSILLISTLTNYLSIYHSLFIFSNF